jgi:hypothetical protein
MPRTASNTSLPELYPLTLLDQVLLIIDYRDVLLGQVPDLFVLYLP